MYLCGDGFLVNGPSSCCDLALPQLLQSLIPALGLKEKGDISLHMAGYKKTATLPQLKRPAHQIRCDPKANSQAFSRAGSAQGERGQRTEDSKRHSAGGTALTGREGHLTQALHLRGGREAAVIFEKGRQMEKFYFQCPHSYCFVQIMND